MSTPIQGLQQSIRPQTPGVHHVALRVSDLARSKQFYVDLLGFELLAEMPGLVLFAAGKTAFGLRAPDEKTPPGDRFDPFRVGLDHVALACTSEQELERVGKALTDAGVENTGVKLDDALGKLYIAFKDPDRIAWEFYMV